MMAGGSVILYLRVSKPRQVENGVSLDMQEAKLRQYCETYDLEVADVVTDGAVTGSRPFAKRPGGQRVMRMLKAGKVDQVVVYDLSRAFRDHLDVLETLKLWQAADVVLHSFTEQIDTSSAMGRLLLNIMASIAQMEREKTGERVKDSMAYLRDAGKRYVRSRFGYRIEVDQELSTPEKTKYLFVPDPEQQAIIKRMKAMAADGMSLRAIAKVLMDEGIKSPRGAETWSASTVRGVINSD